MTQATRAAERAARVGARISLHDKIPQWLRELSPRRRDIHIVLSLAHGGIDPRTGLYVTEGKRSPKWDDNPPVHGENIYYEGVGSRDITYKEKYLLDILGIPNTIVGHAWRDWSIEKKCNIINNLGLDKNRCFGNETHSNASRKYIDTATGFEIFTSPGDTPADPMATIEGEEHQKEFPEQKARTDYATDGDSDKEAKFGILTGTAIPFTLKESTFHNNREYCMEILMKEEGRYRLARAGVKSYVRIINELF